MKHFIITGHSKGLGAGITAALINPNHTLHGISRNDQPDLAKLATAKGSNYFFYSCDLAQNDSIAEVVAQVFQNIDPTTCTGLYLVNNAGVIDPIGPLESLDPLQIDRHLRINLLAPVFLTQQFSLLSQNFRTEKRVLNISSGAAINPYFGWSAYCTGKAGLDMFTRCIATEQEKHEFPVKAMAVAPGIIDTQMQDTIRATTEEQFIHKQKFVELKETGALVPAAIAGKKLADLLLADNFQSGLITDIRNQYA